MAELSKEQKLILADWWKKQEHPVGLSFKPEDLPDAVFERVEKEFPHETMYQNMASYIHALDSAEEKPPFSGFIDLEARDMWRPIMEIGTQREKGVTHKMANAQVVQIVSSIPPVAQAFKNQLGWDMMTAKYKLFDEIGMLLTGRCTGYREPRGRPSSIFPRQIETEECAWSKALARSYLKCADRTTGVLELYDCIINEELPKEAGGLLLK